MLLILSAAALAGFSYLFFSWAQSPAPVMTIGNYQQIEPVETVSHTFEIGHWNIPVTTESYLVWESYLGNLLSPNNFSIAVLALALLLGFVGYMAVISTFSRFYFFAGIGLAFVFLTNLGLNDLGIRGLPGPAATIIVAGAFGLLAYFFQAFRKDVALTMRLLAFALLAALMITLIYFGASVELPLYTIALKGLTPGVVVCIIFWLMTGHEIVAGAVVVATASRSRSMTHFLVLTAFYLINLALTYASQTGLIGWGLVPVHAFVLFSISAVLGIWGFRRMASGDAFASDAAALVFYFSLLLVTLGVMSFVLSSAHTMLTENFEVLILACHFGCGLIFLVYVIANFGSLLAQNLPVQRVLFKPETMPVFTYRIMAVIASFAVVSVVGSWYRYIDQTAATYFNAVADLKMSVGNVEEAEANYKRSLRYRDQNDHAHYGLASLYRSNYESFKEKREYEKIVALSPTPEAYLNLAEVLWQEKNPLAANLMLDDGRKRFPKDQRLANALGLSYLKLRSVDSAYHYFNLASRMKGDTRAGITNSLALATRYRLELSDSTWPKALDGRLVNSLAYFNAKRRLTLDDFHSFNDTTLSVYQATYLANYFNNRGAIADTALIAKALKLAKRPSNEDFADLLRTSAAGAYYAQGEVKRGMHVLRDLAYRGADASVLQRMGLLLLEQQNPVTAAAYFRQAVDRKLQSALYFEAIAELESDSLELAYVSWDSVSRGKNREMAAFAEQMKKVLISTSRDVSNMTDDERYYFCRYKIQITDSSQFETAVQEFKDKRLRDRAIFDRAEKWYRLDDVDHAEALLRRLSENTKYPAEQRLRLLVAADKGDIAFIRAHNAWLEERPVYERLYVEAQLATADKNPTAAAERWKKLEDINDQFDVGLVGAARFFSADTAQRMVHFSKLVDGLLAKPFSARVLKAHILSCLSLGYDQEAQASLEKLQRILPRQQMRKFIQQHPDLFQATSTH